MALKGVLRHVKTNIFIYNMKVVPAGKMS